jgi:hypothetical protein
MFCVSYKIYLMFCPLLLRNVNLKCCFIRQGVMDGQIIFLCRIVIDIKNIYNKDMILRVCTLCLTKMQREEAVCVGGGRKHRSW